MNKQLKVAKQAEAPTIPVSEPNLKGRELELVTECVKSGWVSSIGKYLSQFETSFAEYVKASEAIAICNGTCALHVALVGLEIGPGDEVIVPTFTYIASVNAIQYVGATPVFVDMERDTWNPDVKEIEKKITPRTKAILAVHLYGHPCDMDSIRTLAKKHKLWVVEDAAEAFGTKYKGKPVGNLGDIGIFSFFGNKTITTGEGGMVVTDDAALAKRIRSLKGQGMSAERRYFFEVVGYNYRMTNVEAAIGVAQLERANELISAKRRNALYYTEYLKGIAGLSLPIEKEYAFHSYWMFCVLVEPSFGLTRDEVMAGLAKQGIETRPFFYPVHTMPPYQTKGAKFPIAEKIAAQGINLPSSTLLTKEDIQRVAHALASLKK